MINDNLKKYPFPKSGQQLTDNQKKTRSSFFELFIETEPQLVEFIRNAI